MGRGAMNGSEPVAGDPIMDMAEAARATGGTLHGPAVAFSGVTTDSRAVNAGDLFIALAGERFDGHEYLDEALRRGAVAAITSRRVETSLPAPQAVVDDTRLALGRLAAHWRARFAIPLLALTGSNGKTTVKEMIAAILAAHAGSADAILATRGNLNNDIGMPLTLLGLRRGHRFAVIEMGMNHEGEIDYLTRIAAPTVALVNNAQRAHVGILGSLEAIARAKGEIYAGLGAEGVAIVNADDAFADYWKGLNRGRRVVTFALDAAAQVRGTARGDELHVTLPSGGFDARLQVRGEHNKRNAIAACAAAFALGVPAAAMREALSRFAGVPGRLQRRRSAGGALVIDDTYNANPESMKAAVQVLAEESGRKVFVMGDMGELGGEAPAMHAEVGRFAAGAGIDRLLAVGEASRAAVAAFGERAAHFDAIDALIAEAKREASAGATLLVKGSRFMEMERVAEALAPGDRGAV
jgi:UDP-N-acetylmuramoyl-tripeptide--D-alanyl-D-alanine ligase